MGKAVRSNAEGVAHVIDILHQFLFGCSQTQDMAEQCCASQGVFGLEIPVQNSCTCSIAWNLLYDEASI